MEQGRKKQIPPIIQSPNPAGPPAAALATLVMKKRMTMKSAVISRRLSIPGEVISTYTSDGRFASTDAWGVLKSALFVLTNASMTTVAHLTGFIQGARGPNANKAISARHIHLSFSENLPSRLQRNRFAMKCKEYLCAPLYLRSEEHTSE